MYRGSRDGSSVALSAVDRARTYPWWVPWPAGTARTNGCLCGHAVSDIVGRGSSEAPGRGRAARSGADERMSDRRRCVCGRLSEPAYGPQHCRGDAGESRPAAGLSDLKVCGSVRGSSVRRASETPRPQRTRGRTRHMTRALHGRDRCAHSATFVPRTGKGHHGAELRGKSCM